MSTHTHTRTALLVPVVPAENAIQIIAPVVQNYIERYNTAVSKTALAVLKVACTVLEAKQDLNPVDYGVFLREIGFSEKSTMYKKFLLIAAKRHALEVHLDKLPNAWTTIYQLAKLNPEQFENVANSGKLTPFVTANTITRIVSGDRDARVNANEKVISADLALLSIDTAYEFYSEFEALCKRFHTEVVMRDDFTSLLIDIRQAAQKAPSAQEAA